MQGQLSVAGVYLDADDWVCGLSDGSILDLRDNRVRAATADDRVRMHLGCRTTPSVVGGALTGVRRCPLARCGGSGVHKR